MAMVQIDLAANPDRSVSAARSTAVALFAPYFVGLTTERFQIAHLDAGRRLLHHDRGEIGRADATSVPMRRIVYDAVAHGTACWVAAHNHPSGDPAPSRADLLITRRLVDMARAIDIVLLDHLIVAGERLFSFREAGLL